MLYLRNIYDTIEMRIGLPTAAAAFCPIKLPGLYV